MQTLLLGTEQVRSYLEDLKSRLTALGTECPAVWVPLGYSGTALLREFFSLSPDLSDRSPIVVDVNCRQDEAGAQRIVWGENDSQSVPQELISGRNVIVIDSAVHSGKTMTAVVHALWQAGAAGVCSYTLVLKESSSFVPNFWAVSISDEDRAFFLLQEIPNNRFVRKYSCSEMGGTEDESESTFVKHKPQRLPYFAVRRLTKEDLGKDKFQVNVESLNRSKWEDLYFSAIDLDNYWVYVLECKSEIIGYIALSLAHDRELSVEQIGVSSSEQGRGYAGALMRWAETLARLKDCNHIRLWSILGQRDTYAALGYRELAARMDLGAEKYVRMSKCLLPHTGCCSPATPRQSS